MAPTSLRSILLTVFCALAALTIGVPFLLPYPPAAAAAAPARRPAAAPPPPPPRPPALGRQ